MDKAKAILFNTGLKHWNFSQEVLGSISGHCFRNVAIGKAVQSRSLTLSQTTNFRLFESERICRRQYQIDANDKVLKPCRKHWGKEEIARYEQFLLFPQWF